MNILKKVVYWFGYACVMIAMVIGNKLIFDKYEEEFSDLLDD